MKPTILCLVPHVIRPPPHTEVAPPQANYSQLLAHVWLWRCPLGGSRSTMQTLFHQISVSKARSRTNEKVRKKLCASRFFWGEGKGGSFSFSFLHSTNQLCVSELPDFFVDFFLLALCHYLSSNSLAVTVFVNEQSRQTLAGWDWTLFFAIAQLFTFGYLLAPKVFLEDRWPMITIPSIPIQFILHRCSSKGSCTYYVITFGGPEGPPTPM